MPLTGRNAAVADIGSLHISGFMAWLIWLFVHISFLIGFDNKVLVLIQWAWYYLTRKRGARLITGDSLCPLVCGWHLAPLYHLEEGNRLSADPSRRGQRASAGRLHDRPPPVFISLIRKSTV